MSEPVPFERWTSELCVVPSIGMTVDASRMGHAQAAVDKLQPQMVRAFDAMVALEGGAIANPDEKRQVGHYWLRAPELAPTPELRKDIEGTLARIKSFVADVHSGAIAPPDGGKFTDVIVVGIGGSALGPQLAARALGPAGDDQMAVHFLDNTDPDGFDLVLDRVRGRFPWTLVIVISKSGGTKETRNGMLEVKAAMEAAHVTFRSHAVAITGEGSALDRVAVD